MIRYLILKLKLGGQSKNPAWEKGKMLQNTSINHFGRICKATSRTDFEKLAKNLVTVKRIKTVAISSGGNLNLELGGTGRVLEPNSIGVPKI